MNILIFDTETTGFTHNTIIQIAWKLVTHTGDVLEKYSAYLNNGVPSEPGAFRVHKITEEIRKEQGVSNDEVYAAFTKATANADKVCAHNLTFDSKAFAMTFKQGYPKLPGICTMRASTEYCKLPGNYGRYKWPTLVELHQILFNEGFDGAHDAMNDVNATHRCLKELITKGVINV